MNNLRSVYSKISKNIKLINLSIRPNSQNVNANVPGLSEKVLSVPQKEVGPGASKSGAYKNPEYFSYHKNSYFEAEIEMLKYRCPQPSAKPKKKN